MSVLTLRVDSHKLLSLLKNLTEAFDKVEVRILVTIELIFHVN